jgi:hypothetical protein
VIVLKKITAFFVIFIMIVSLNFLLVGIVSATPGDLDNDGLVDVNDPETIISSSISLPAGEYSFQTLVITNGASLILNSDSSLSGFKGVRINAQNILIDANSAISADGRGYPANQGPGVGMAKCDYWGCRYGGGGYGGIGNSFDYIVGGIQYGSPQNPLDLGSGGGGWAGYVGLGGGAIRLSIADTLTIQGEITSNGNPGRENSGGSGSGGSIYITTHNLAGSGSILANGGDGYRNGGVTSGSGGGGRIAVHYQSSAFSGSAQAIGGKSFYEVPKAGNGTVVFVDTQNNIIYPGHDFTFDENDGASTSNSIILRNSRVITKGNPVITTTSLLSESSSLDLDGSSSITSSTADLTDSSVTLTGAQMLTIPSVRLERSSMKITDSATLQFDAITLEDGSVLTTYPLQKIDLTLQDLQIDATSAILLNGLGYPDSQGPGAGQTKCTQFFGCDAGGGGYGGPGGTMGDAQGGIPYGSPTQPFDLGSGSGGGAVHLSIADTLNLNGKIAADGNSASYGSSAGSGGSVYIITKHFQGSGIISADGGDGGYFTAAVFYRAACGGGGRIAVDYKDTMFNGITSTNGGSGYGEISCQQGTIITPPPNRGPSLDSIGPKSIEEGGKLEFPVSGSDPDNDSLTYTATGLPAGAIFDSGTKTFVWTPDFSQAPGPYMITFTVSDGVLTDSEEVSIMVENVNRAPELEPIGSKFVNGNEHLQFVISASDPDSDPLSYTAIDIPTGATFDPVTKTFSWTPDNSQAGIHQVTFEVSDGSLTDSQKVVITVTAVQTDTLAPLIQGITATPNPVAINTNVALTAIVDDRSTGNSNIASVQYSTDGTSWIQMQATDGAFNSPYEAVNTILQGYANPDILSIKIKASDAAGYIALSEPLLLVIYDPSGGFVTGGGWIVSPAGAYIKDPSLAGKANFGFVSKYQKNANVPTGETEFQFTVGGLNFHSGSYEWLVVSGPKAQFKGTGTVNGQGNYGFMLTAIDGALNGGGGSDKFRIKIWNKAANDALVYDNQQNLADSADPTTIIGGGSIIIHKSK